MPRKCVCFYLLCFFPQHNCSAFNGREVIFKRAHRSEILRRNMYKSIQHICANMHSISGVNASIQFVNYSSFLTFHVFQLITVKLSSS